MTRVTDTREAVRLTAALLVDEGLTPSPTLVRARLGRGSMNTIVDELRRWRAETSSPGPQGAALALQPAAERVAQKPAQASDELVKAAQALSADALRQAALLDSILPLLMNIEARESAAVSALSSLNALVKEQEQRNLENLHTVRTELDKLNARFEGVQKHMLLQVSEARDVAASWKDRYMALKQETSVWRDTLQAQILALNQEVSYLRGKQGLPPASSSLRPQESSVRVSLQNRAAAGPVAGLSGYPGHPRAGPLHDEFDE